MKKKSDLHKGIATMEKICSTKGTMRVLIQLQLHHPHGYGFRYLHQETGLNETAFMRALRKLRAYNLIDKKGDVYKLTKSGRALMQAFQHEKNISVRFQKMHDATQRIQTRGEN